MDRIIQKKLIFIVCLIFSVVIYGTAGYMFIEKMNLLDALYMTVITLATVGYKEVKELTINGKIFTIILIISGFGVFTYALTTGAKVKELRSNNIPFVISKKNKENLPKDGESLYIEGDATKDESL